MKIIRLRLFNLHSFCSGSGDVLPSPPMHESEAETRPFLRLTAAIPNHSLTFLLGRLLSVHVPIIHIIYSSSWVKLRSSHKIKIKKRKVNVRLSWQVAHLLDTHLAHLSPSIWRSCHINAAERERGQFAQFCFFSFWPLCSNALQCCVFPTC